MSGDKWVVRLGFKGTFRYAFLTILIISAPVYANPIQPDLYGGSAGVVMFLFISSSALLIEYLVVRYLLKPQFKCKHVMPAFLFANILSFPLTTIYGMAFGPFAEIIPLTVEPIWYMGVAKICSFDIPGIRQKIISANLISYGVGLVMYHIFSPIDASTLQH